ncbi:hypothetical protein KUTeg_011656 [Tegillarca granosa]|uniref:FHA domain-containing protein n=1 Tax=Tegillarca granosa TaxID=220873 RepID=A0ABQ9F0R6_TEGGR|nr:hypothetical protein KUTeg_011656 [Tegillarca granosa]
MISDHNGFQSIAKIEEEKKKQEDRKVIPHFWNLNEDPSLTAMVVHFCKPGTLKIGNKKASPTPDIILNGLSIQQQHAEVTNKGGDVKLKPFDNAKIMVNGQKISKETQLKHNDRGES